jgi:outer membrane protein
VIYMTGGRRCSIVVALAFLMSRLATAQASQPASQSRLTLSEAISRAETNYPKVLAAVEQHSAAQAAIGVARTAYLPRTDLVWQTNRATANNIYGLLLPQSVIPPISGPVRPADNSRDAWGSGTGALVTWQPFDFGLRKSQVDAARHLATAASAGERLTRLDVALATANVYFDLATAQQFVAVAQANVNRLQVFAKTVGVLAKQELRAGADASQADASLARAQTELIQAQTSVSMRRAVLADLVGMPPDQVDLADEQLLSSVPAEAVPNMPLEAHPAVQQESSHVNQQQARLRAIDRSYVPQFNTQAAISGRGSGTALTGAFPGGTNGLAPDTFNWAVGWQVTFAAFDYFSLRGQKKVQESNLRAEQHRYEETLKKLSVEVEQAQAQLEGAIKVAKNTPVELAVARQSELQQRARFDAGLATVVDVAVAENLLVQAETDDVVARLNVWRGYAALAAAQGDLSSLMAQLKRP